MKGAGETYAIRGLTSNSATVIGRCLAREFNEAACAGCRSELQGSRQMCAPLRWLSLGSPDDVGACTPLHGIARLRDALENLKGGGRLPSLKKLSSPIERWVLSLSGVDQRGRYQ